MCRAQELLSSALLELRQYFTLYCHTRAMSFFQVPLSCFSVLFSFIIVCAAAPAGGRGLISFKKWADYTFISVFTLMTFYLV